MSIELHLRPDHHLAILIHIGTIPDDEFLSFYESLYENKSFNPTMDQLIDLRQADSEPRSPDVLRQFSEYVRTAFQDITKRPKIAVVAPKDLSFGLARMYQAFASSVPWEFMVFRAMGAALAWLGLPEDLMERSNPDTELGREANDHSTAL